MEDSKLYLVLKQGIHHHGVVVCSDKDKAIKIADNAAKADEDDYHEYCVYEIKADTYYELYKFDFEKMKIYTTRKLDGRKTFMGS